MSATVPLKMTWCNADDYEKRLPAIDVSFNQPVLQHSILKLKIAFRRIWITLPNDLEQIEWKERQIDFQIVLSLVPQSQFYSF